MIDTLLHTAVGLLLMTLLVLGGFSAVHAAVAMSLVMFEREVAQASVVSLTPRNCDELVGWRVYNWSRGKLIETFVPIAVFLLAAAVAQ